MTLLYSLLCPATDIAMMVMVLAGVCTATSWRGNIDGIRTTRYDYCLDERVLYSDKGSRLFLLSLSLSLTLLPDKCVEDTGLRIRVRGGGPHGFEALHAMQDNKVQVEFVSRPYTPLSCRRI